MNPSIKKLRKFFRLEAERGYDNKAVMGGLANILSSWEMDAREDQLPEQIIQAVISRLRDYHHLSEDSREVALKGIWQRVIKETGGDIKDPQEETLPPPAPPSSEVPPSEGSPPQEEVHSPEEGVSTSEEPPVQAKTPQLEPALEKESPATAGDSSVPGPG